MVKKEEQTKKKQSPAANAVAKPRGIRTTEEGMVVKDALSISKHKTVTVRLERFVQHPKFKKYIRRHKKMLAHDEKNECRNGDRVEMVLVPPMSKSKRWKITKVLEKAK